MKPRSSFRYYVRHHLASIVFAETFIIAFSHAILIWRACDRLVDCHGGMFSHHLGWVNEEVRHYSEAYFTGMFRIVVFYNGIVLTGNGW